MPAECPPAAGKSRRASRQPSAGSADEMCPERHNPGFRVKPPWGAGPGRAGLLAFCLLSVAYFAGSLFHPTQLRQGQEDSASMAGASVAAKMGMPRTILTTQDEPSRCNRTRHACTGAQHLTRTPHSILAEVMQRMQAIGFRPFFRGRAMLPGGAAGGCRRSDFALLMPERPNAR